MDADVAALQRFAEVPYVIEAPAARPDAAVPAMRALAAAGGRIALDESKGPAAPGYSAIVKDIRSRLASEVEVKDRYRIEVLDLGAESLDDELARASASLKGKTKAFHQAYAGMSGAFSFLLQDKPDRTTCVAVGYKADVTFAKMAEMAAGVRSVKPRDLTDEAYHRLTLWHEVGHCLMGTDEAKADTFAALMAVRFGDLSRQGLSVYAAFREVNEIVTHDLRDDHIMSRALWAVAERAEGLRADPGFMAMDVQGIVALAKAFVSKEGPRPEDEAHVVATRAAYRVAAKERLHKLPGGGRPVAFFRWAQETSSALPEIARLVQLERALATDGADIPAPAARRTAEDLRLSLAGLKAKGDVTSSKMLTAVNVHVLDNPAVKRKGEAWDAINPYSFDVAEAHVRLVSAPAPAREALPEEDDAPPGPAR